MQRIWPCVKQLGGDLTNLPFAIREGCPPECSAARQAQERARLYLIFREPCFAEAVTSLNLGIEGPPSFLRTAGHLNQTNVLSRDSCSGGPEAFTAA